MMSLDSFKTMLANIPKNVMIDFSGFCEPCVNPQFSEMAKTRRERRLQIHVATTLQGASNQTVKTCST